MNCKKCGAEGIDDQAFNAPGGGFLCKACYRRFQVKSAGLGLVLAVVGVLAVLAFLIFLLIWSWPPGS